MDTGNPENYGKAGLDYYLKVIFRKISNFFLSYPEFIFMGKILLGLIVLVALFLLFSSLFAPKEPVFDVLH